MEYVHLPLVCTVVIECISFMSTNCGLANTIFTLSSLTTAHPCRCTATYIAFTTAVYTPVVETFLNILHHEIMIKTMSDMR